ncbi:hypothetical protein CBF30_03380 [Vagococcus entomophilus]|uniref:Gram-positive cocci surface proteins LPxTG domain-containing protein n=2 Tax=Vagococcus entomophilus TaxID=1160095 RepID=A0A430AJK7_9ENTE|nr:hypothetical protein CBF30_03380 [Vagococcus entomophilus]
MMKNKFVWLMLISVCSMVLVDPVYNVYATEKGHEVQNTDSNKENLSTTTSTTASSSSSSPLETTSSVSEVGTSISQNQLNAPKASSDEKLTVTFVNQTEKFSQTQVAKNTPVSYPGSPAPSGDQVTFVGWFTDPTQGEQFDFSRPVENSMTLYARFSNTYLVQYKDQTGKIVDSKSGISGQTIPKSSVEPISPVGQYFSYWYEEGDTAQTPINFEDTTLSKNLVLVPKFNPGRTVLFISEGTQISPEYVKEGSLASQPVEPSRSGYTFSHWATEKDGKEAYSFDTPITKDTTLYAVWTPVNATYTIVYWLEKPNLASDPGTDPTNYSFSWSTVKQDAKSEDIVTINQSLADRIKNANNQGQAALKYSEYAFSPPEQISGNGQTVVNVYYKRTIYQLNFELNNTNAEMVANGQTYKGTDFNRYSIQAKYGEDIKDRWPEVPVVAGGATSFHGWKYPDSSDSAGSVTTGNPMTLTSSLISTNGQKSMTLIGNYLNGNQENVRKIYMESLDDTGENYAGTYYQLFDTQVYNSISNRYIPDEFYGFAFYTKEETDTRHGSYYYLRNQHTLTYNTQGGDLQGQEETTSKKYQENLTAPNDPIRSGYVFAGWYFDSSYKEKVDFNSLKMPDGDLTLFAKWESTKNIVRYFDSIKGTQLLQQGYENNEYIHFPSDYVRGQTYVEGKGLFDGWYWQLGSSSFEFSDTIPITKNIDLYAKWITDGFYVSYDFGEGDGDVPLDNNAYNLTTKALVQDSTGIQPPEGKVFIGWKVDQDNTVYYPGDYVQVRGNITLTAVYASKEDLVHIVYHAGDYPNHPEDVIQDAIKQSTVVVKGAIFKRADKTLVGWSKEKNGAKDYSLGEVAVPVGSSDIDLYAVWEDKKVNISFVPGENGTLDYGDHAITTSVNYGTKWKDSTIAIPTPKADAGYEFAGWSPKLLEANDSLTNDQIFTAQFIKKTTGSVTIRYVDQNGETIAADKLISGASEESYDVSTSAYKLETIGDYNLIGSSGTLKGTFGKENHLVLYTYKKATGEQTGEVQVRYIDSKGKKIRDSLVIKGKVGQPYNVKGSNILIEGYHFVATSGVVVGTFAPTTTVITHLYEAGLESSGQVTIHYVDKDGNRLHDDRILQGKIGEAFSLNSHLLTIEGYQFDRIIGGQEGRFTTLSQEKTVIYQKNKANVTTSDTASGNAEAKRATDNKNALPKTGESKQNLTITSLGGALFLLGLLLFWKKRTKN